MTGDFPCFFCKDWIVAIGNWSVCASMYLSTYSSASVSVNLCFSTCEDRQAHTSQQPQDPAPLSQPLWSLYLYGGSYGKVLWLIEGWLFRGSVGFGHSHPLQELASQNTGIPAAWNNGWLNMGNGNETDRCGGSNMVMVSSER